MVHAALLLLMLEAANARPRFTISLKRSTQNLPLSTSSPADYPISLASGARKTNPTVERIVSFVREEMIMRVIIILSVLFAACGIPTDVPAQQSNECKLCREVQQACLKNHTKDACNHEYRIRMNHCRKK
jgi:hypothetical protein